MNPYIKVINKSKPYANTRPVKDGWYGEIIIPITYLKTKTEVECLMESLGLTERARAFGENGAISNIFYD